MKEGSGSRANPWAAAEVRAVGFSLKRNSAPSRAPAASMMAEQKGAATRIVLPLGMGSLLSSSGVKYVLVPRVSMGITVASKR